MSGSYVPCHPTPDLTSLPLFGFIGFILHAYWIVCYLIFYFKSPMKSQKNSSSSHQSYQSIISLQLLPDYLFDAFCNYVHFCSLPHTITSSKSWLPSESIFNLIYYGMLESLLNLTWFLSHPGMYLAHLEWLFSCLHSWCLCWPYPIQVWLLWLHQIKHFCQWYFKGQLSSWDWNYYPQVCWHQGTFCLLDTSGLSSLIIWGLPF